MPKLPKNPTQAKPVAKLGHPKPIFTKSLNSASQIPTPSPGYYAPFATDVGRVPKSRRFVGSGRLRNNVQTSVFSRDAKSFPM
jgi:hypothetical protein